MHNEDLALRICRGLVELLGHLPEAEIGPEEPLCIRFNDSGLLQLVTGDRRYQCTNCLLYTSPSPRD